LNKVVAVPRGGIDPGYKVRCVVADATETQIQRPKKDQKVYYSGKMKRHTVKTEAMIDLSNGQIVAVSDTTPGSVHDFAVHKKMKHLPTKTLLLADSGYQGVAALHSRSWIPDKKPKNGTLSASSKMRNSALAILRVSIENIFAKLKVFKILTNKYRNRLERYNRTFRIIIGIVNREMRRLDVLGKWRISLSSRIKKSMALLLAAKKLLEAGVHAG
jgi:hypothetical protein